MAPPGDVIAGRTARPPQEWLANLIRSLHRRAAVAGQDGGVQPGILGGEYDGAKRTKPEICLDSLSAGVCQIVRPEFAEICQAASGDNDDLVLEAVVKPGDIENGTIIEKALFDSRIEADVFFGLEAGIVGKCHVESAGIADARAEASVKPRSAERLSSCFAEEISSGEARIDLGHGTFGYEGTRKTIRWKRAGAKIVDAQAHGQEKPARWIPAIFGEVGVTCPRQNERSKAGVRNEGVFDLLMVIFETVDENILRGDL